MLINKDNSAGKEPKVFADCDDLANVFKKVSNSVKVISIPKTPFAIFSSPIGVRYLIPVLAQSATVKPTYPVDEKT